MRLLVSDLERAHLSPRRPHFAQSHRAVRGMTTGREAWERLAAEDLVPPGERLFRITTRELARAGHRESDLRRINLTHVVRAPRSLALPHPPTPEAAAAYASVEGLAAAEQHAREYLVRLEPFRFLLERDPPPGARTPVWRILGSPVAPVDAGPELCDVEGAHALANLASHLASTPLLQTPVARFRAALTHASAAELWIRAERPIPVQVRVGARLIPTPPQLMRLRLAQLPNPFEPLVEIWRLGFGIRRLSKETILLYLPHPPSPADRAAGRIPVRSVAEGELSRALLRVDAPAVLELLDRGVDPNGEDDNGRTALHAAVLAGHRMQTALLSALLSAGADPEREDEDGMTALALAVARDERRLATALLDLGLDPQARLGGGRSLLHVAARAGSARMIELLVERGLDPNVRCLRGRTPLHEAAGSRSSYAEEAGLALLRRGAESNARDRFGWTPLHHASINLYGGAGIARVLIAAGARALPDRAGLLPADYAAKTVMGTEVFDQVPRGVTTPLEPLPSLPRHPELEEAIHAAPDDPGPWSVYADWLAAQQDPRAELIQLGLAAERSCGDEKRILLRMIRRAHQDRQVEIFGELQRLDHLVTMEQRPEYGFEHGFLVRLDYRRSDVSQLRAVLTSSATTFLRDLSASGAQSTIQLLEGLGSRSLCSLSLAYCATPLEASLAAALPRVRRLTLVGILPRTVAWPGLEELTFVATTSLPRWPALGRPIDVLDARLPDLLRLRICSRIVGQVGPLALARASLPKLKALAFEGAPETFREIAHAEWFGRLERLDLLRAHPDTIVRLERLLSEGLRLRRVRLVARHLSTADKRALAARLSVHVPKVRVS